MTFGSKHLRHWFKKIMKKHAMKEWHKKQKTNPKLEIFLILLATKQTTERTAASAKLTGGN